MSYESEIAWLTKHPPKLVRKDPLPLLDTTELEVEWQDVPDTLVNNLCVYLETCTDIINTSNPSFSVVSPQAVGARGLEAHAGTWRIVSVHRSGPAETDTQTIRRVLRLGFSSSLVWAEARLVQPSTGHPADKHAVTDPQGNTGTEVFHAVQFHSLNPMVMSTLQASLLTTETLSNPVVNGTTLTGTWYITQVSPVTAEDGSGQLIAQLTTKGSTFTGYTSYNRANGEQIIYKIGVPKTLVLTVTEWWKTEKGEGASAHVAYGQGLANIVLSYPNVDVEHLAAFLSAISKGHLEYTSIWWGCTDKEAHPLSEHAHYDEVGWTLSRNVSHGGNGGFYDIRLTALFQRYQHLSEYTSEISAGGVVTREEFDGVKADDKDDEGGEISLPDMASAAEGSIKGVSRQQHSNGTQRISVSEDTPADLEGTTEEHSAAEDVLETRHSEGASIADKTAATGTVRRVSEENTRAGNKRTSDRVGTPNDQTSTSEEHSAAEDVVEVRHTEGETVADKAAAEGTIRRVRESPTPAGNTRTSDRVETPADQASAGGSDSAAEAAVVVGHTEGPALGTIVAAAGTIVNGVESPTKAGKFRTRRNTATPKDQAFAGGLVSAARVEVVVGHTEGAALGALSAAAGTVVRGEESPTRAGNTRTRKVTASPSALRINKTFETRYGTGRLIWARNQLAAQLTTDLALITEDYNVSPSITFGETGDLYNYSFILIPHQNASGGARTYEDFKFKYNVVVNDHLTERTIWVKYFSAASGPTAVNHVNASDAPGGNMVAEGPMWKAIRVNDVCVT